MNRAQKPDDMLHKWERVSEDADNRVIRMKVPDGWIYLISELGEFRTTILFQHAVFTPRPLPGLQEAMLIAETQGGKFEH